MDHILINKAWKNAAKDVETLVPMATDSDHKLSVVEVTPKLATKNKTGQRQGRGKTGI